MRTRQGSRIARQKDIIKACIKNLENEETGGFAFNDDMWIKYGLHVRKGEADIQRYIYQHANHRLVYTPKVLDFFTAPLTNKQSEQWGVIVMERISGYDWDHYLKEDYPPTERKQQLTRIVKAIKHIWEIPVDPTAKPGPFGGHEPVGTFFDFVEFDEDLQNYRDLEQWINRRLEDKRRFDQNVLHKETSDHLKHISFHKEPMCIAHCDLNPSNIFVSQQQITIIDWGWAGVYNKLFDIYGIFTLQATRFPTFVKFGFDLYDHLFEEETPRYKDDLKKKMYALGKAASH